MSTAPTSITRRTRKPIAATGTNVVALRKRETADDLVAEIEARRQVESAELLRILQRATDTLQARKEERLQSLYVIGKALDAQGLSDWIEVGRRLAGWGPGR